MLEDMAAQGEGTGRLLDLLAGMAIDRRCYHIQPRFEQHLQHNKLVSNLK